MLRLVTAPTAPIVTLAELKKQVHTEYYTDDDAYLQSLELAATQKIDGADGWLGRALKEQVWEYALDKFPCVSHGGYAPIYIPLPPLVSVDSVSYTASDGTATALTGFRVFNVGGTQPAYIVPAVDETWPATKGEPEAVVITFTAGYTTVPEGIRHAIRLLVAHWFENRESVSELKMQELPLAYSALLAPHRNWRG